MFGSIPAAERKTFWKGPFELLTGSYPRFLFGGAVSRCLPVFHFHDVTRAQLEPYLQFLTDNHYRTVTSEALARLVRDGMHPGPQTVVLCFDDAWASLWCVAAPLLRRYGYQAIAYVAPARIIEAEQPRATLDDPAWNGTRTGPPLATWPELRALHTAGTVDLQAHTWSHSKVFCSDRLLGFVTPAYAATLLSRPLVNAAGEPAHVQPDEFGAPLYPTRPRMADVLRFLENPEGRAAAMDYVRAHGGAAFFSQPNWDRELRRVMEPFPGRYETSTEQTSALTAELTRARDILAARLNAADIRHMCFPWTVAGRQAEVLARQCGYATAFADRLFGVRAVRAGDPPYRLMRLRHSFIFRLPGRGRRSFLRVLRLK